jgi:hypothetical protein
MLLFIGCQAAPEPARPMAVAVPTAIAAAPAAASSAPVPPPCTPPLWIAVDAPAARDAAFGEHEPDRAKLAAAGTELRVACRRIELDAKQRLSAEFGSGPGPFGAEQKKAVRQSTTMGCYAGTKGAWAIELGIFHRQAQGAGDEAPWQLVYLTPDAKRVTSPEVRGVQWEADGEGRIGTSIDGVYDFDGDGVDEVALREAGYASIDGFHDSGPKLYRLQAGAIVRWDPVPGRHVAGSKDVDRDGRVDLLLTNGSPRLELAHALASGGFSTDDDVTRSFFHAQCLQPLQSPDPMMPPAPLPAGVSSHVSGPVEERCAQLRALDTACPPGK